MAEDTMFEFAAAKEEENSGRETVKTTLEHVEKTYEQFRKASDEHVGRADDFDFEAGGNDSGFDDIWGI